MGLILHILTIILILSGFYFFYVMDSIVNVQMIVNEYTITMDALGVYTVLLVLFLILYAIVRFALMAGGLSDWVMSYNRSRKNEYADKLTRQAIEAWIMGDMHRAGKKFAKASDIVGPDPLRDIFEAWILSSRHQLQLADAKVLNLLNKKLIHQDSSAGIRARIYMERGQPVVAAAILEQQFENRMHRGLLMLYCQCLGDHKESLRTHFIEKVLRVLPHWRLVNKTKTFADILREAVRLAVESKDERFHELWQYAKSTLKKDDTLFFEFQRRCQIDMDVKGGVAWLISQLKRGFSPQLYACLGLYEFQLEEQLALAKRWRSHATREVESKVLARLYLRSNDAQGSLEHARDYLLLIDQDR